MKYRKLNTEEAERRSVSILKDYVRDKYNETYFDVTDKNIEYDYITSSGKKIELKTRVYGDDNLKHLVPRDILIECIQNVVDCNYATNHRDPYRLNTSIGWMYKCNADRLIQISYLGDSEYALGDDALYDIIDIDWQRLKTWIFNHTRTLDKLVVSNISTGSLNYAVKLTDITDIMFRVRGELCIDMEGVKG